MDVEDLFVGEGRFDGRTELREASEGDLRIGVVLGGSTAYRRAAPHSFIVLRMSAVFPAGSTT